ncbi:MerR family transcriptional regulator [Mariniluteicoccus flavus]
MRIGELAEESGVSARSLRYYEELGLIRAARTAGGWRDFDEASVERVIMIQHLLAAGLCGVTIGELLPCLEAPPEERTGVMERLLAQEVERLEAKRRDLDRELDTLRALQREA